MSQWDTEVIRQVGEYLGHECAEAAELEALVRDITSYVAANSNGEFSSTPSEALMEAVRFGYLCGYDRSGDGGGDSGGGGRTVLPPYVPPSPLTPTKASSGFPVVPLLLVGLGGLLLWKSRKGGLGVILLALLLPP